MPTIRSLAYPLSIVNGSLAVSEDADVLRDSIIQVLETLPYERVMRIDYGTPELLFRSVRSLPVVVEQVRLALVAQVAGVEFSVTGSATDDGGVALTVAWAIDRIPQPDIQFTLTA